MDNQQEDKPPLFASWTQWYVLVLVFLIVLVVLFTLFHQLFLMSRRRLDSTCPYIDCYHRLWFV